MAPKIRTAILALLLSVVACNAATAAPQYFPDGVFGQLDWLNSGWPDTFQDYLSEADEPIISAASNTFRARAVLMTAFHKSAVVRLEQDGSRLVAHIKYYRTPSALSLISSRSFSVSGARVGELQTWATGHNFWSIDSNSNLIMTDGASCLVEINDHGHYHAAYTVWEGDWADKKAVYELALKIFAAAGIRPPEQL